MTGAPAIAPARMPLEESSKIAHCKANLQSSPFKERNIESDEGCPFLGRTSSAVMVTGVRSRPRSCCSRGRRSWCRSGDSVTANSDGDKRALNTVPRRTRTASSHRASSCWRTCFALADSRPMISAAHLIHAVVVNGRLVRSGHIEHARHHRQLRNNRFRQRWKTKVSMTILEVR